MRDDTRGRRPGGRSRPASHGRRRPEPEYDEEPLDDIDEEFDEEPAPRARRRAPVRRAAKKRPAGRKPARGGRVDFGSIEDEDDYEDAPRGEEEDYDADYEDEYERPRRRRPSRAPKRRERLTLMDLCTPVFGFAAILPRDPGGIHPGYQQFREQVMGALQRIEAEAPEHGIEVEDAREARYALCLFMDEQVNESEWSAKMEWSSEPLGLVLLEDPEGGVNFFNHLDALGQRQKAVKEVYLVCLSMGFLGKFAEADPTQQATRIGELKQKLLRSIHPMPLDRREFLFPEAYVPAEPLEDEAPPPPRWWLVASLGTLLLSLLVYVFLYWQAGRIPDPAEKRLKELRSSTEISALETPQEAVR